MLEELAGRVRLEKPRFFAICGIYEDPPVLEGEDPSYVEWGMEFPDSNQAVCWSPGSLTRSSSAEKILKLNAKMGPAQLVRFE